MKIKAQEPTVYMTLPRAVLNLLRTAPRVIPSIAPLRIIISRSISSIDRTR